MVFSRAASETAGHWSGQIAAVTSHARLHCLPHVLPHVDVHGKWRVRRGFYSGVLLEVASHEDGEVVIVEDVHRYMNNPQSMLQDFEDINKKTLMWKALDNQVEKMTVDDELNIEPSSEYLAEL